MRSLRRVGPAVLVVAAATASLTCSDDPAAPELRPAALVQVSGDDQQGMIGHALPDSLVVRVGDAQGRPVSGVSVFWTTSGGGQVHPTMTVTTAEGLAAVQRTMGDTAGEHRTTATVPDLPPVIFTAVAETGTEVPHLLLSSQPSSAAESGVVLEQQPVLRALDASGDPLPAGLEVTATASGATLSGTATVTSDAGGDVTFTDLALTGPDGNYALTFSAPGLTPVQSRQIALSATTGGKLSVVTQPSTTAANAVPFTRQPVIRVLDGGGAPLGAGVSVTVSVNGGASLTGTRVVPSNGSGDAHFTDLALSGASGNYTLTFSAPDLASVQSTAIALTSTTSDGGSWTAPFDWPVVGVHMVLLPDGKVLTLGRVGQPYVWDPATGTFTASPSPAWLFCSGHNLLPDGRVLFAGGHISDHHGLPTITMYGASGWATSAPMARGRWYPSTTVMGNGDVVIMAGEDEQAVTVDVPEVWSNGTVRQLTGAPQVFPFYPRAFVAPDGRLYYAGAAGQTRYLSLAGNGSWTSGPPRLYPGRNYGSAVMYDDGKILYAGGGYTTNTAEVIDLNEAAPAWRWTSPMAFARRHLNLTVLPTGEVLATGGVAGTIFNDISTGVHAAEIWNPATGQWTTLASSAITRGYHATSLLLPDGRVLHGGSGDGAGAPNQRNAEIFSPPYLFRGARPTITGGPTDVAYGSTFHLDTPDPASITHVSLIRLGAVTHAFDQGQRFQRLVFTADANGLQVTAPASGNRAPPGYYMVFILNGADVPSVGKIVRVH
jgi:galactose oxidase-like protein